MARSLRGLVAALVIPLATPAIALADEPGDDKLADPWREAPADGLSTSGTSVSGRSVW
jgi:hypothetical protein